MDAKIEIFDVTDSECLLIAAALNAGSQKTIEELILEFRAAKNSPAGLACSELIAADQADRDLQFARLQACITSAS